MDNINDKEKKERKEEIEQEEIDEVKEGLHDSEDVKEETENEVEEHDLLQTARDFEDKYKRALADYQNLQRRSIDERREWARFSNKELLLKLLPILDTLMLAEKHTKDQNFSLTVKQFLQVLEQEGVKKIKTIGEEFNPHTMEAVSVTEGESNKVIDEARAGYMYEDIVLRPAQVVVGK